MGDELLSFFVMKKNDLGIKCVSIRMCTLFYIRTSNFYPRLNVLIIFQFEAQIVLKLFLIYTLSYFLQIHSKSESSLATPISKHV